MSNRDQLIQQIKDKVQAALIAAFATKKPGFDITSGLSGFVYKTYLEAVILNAVAPHGFGVTITTPAGDTTVNGDHVVVLGAVTATVNVVTP